MGTINFIISEDEDGGYVAKSVLDNGTIVTQGDSMQELKEMILDAIDGYFFDKPTEKPKQVMLKFEEILAVA